MNKKVETEVYILVIKGNNQGYVRLQCHSLFN